MTMERSGPGCKNAAFNLNLYIIRICAFFCVVGIHAFSYSGFYELPVVGKNMFIMVCLRGIFRICVPLFIMLSGYTCRHYKYSKKLFVRAADILLVYFLCSAVCLLFRIKYTGIVPTLSVILSELADFSIDPYGWYVEMYLGLLLIMPLLNAGFNALSKNQRLALLGCLLCVCSLSTIIPGYAFFDYWGELYPLLYYFTGSYIAEHGPKIKKRVLLPLLLAAVLLSGLVAYLFNYGKPFAWGNYEAYNSIYVFAIALPFFLAVLALNTDRFPLAPQKPIAYLAKCSLPAYLLSYCFDMFMYPLLYALLPPIFSFPPFDLICVPVIFLCALAAGAVMTELVKLIKKPFSGHKKQ